MTGVIFELKLLLNTRWIKCYSDLSILVFVICLLFSCVLIGDIIVLFHSRYVRALGSLYMRLTGSSIDCYKYLEPLYLDYRKLKRQKKDGCKFSHTCSHGLQVHGVKSRGNWPCDLIAQSEGPGFKSQSSHDFFSPSYNFHLHVNQDSGYVEVSVFPISALWHWSDCWNDVWKDPA